MDVAPSSSALSERAKKAVVEVTCMYQRWAGQPCWACRWGHGAAVRLPGPPSGRCTFLAPSRPPSAPPAAASSKSRGFSACTFSKALPMHSLYHTKADHSLLAFFSLIAESWLRFSFVIVVIMSQDLRSWEENCWIQQRYKERFVPGDYWKLLYDQFLIE